MSRVFAILLLLTGLSVVAPPAHAAVSVTISATPSTLVVGDQAVIKGKAVNAKPGSVVKLQRKVDGTWRAVASKKVWAARTYSFARKPTRGVHTYRVVKPRQLGQPYAASPTVKVTVTGPLSVTISASPTSLTVGSKTTISGKAVNALPGSVVQLQNKVDGAWQQVASKKVWSARTYSFVVAPVVGSHSYRVVKPRQLGQPYVQSSSVGVDAHGRPAATIAVSPDDLVLGGTATITGKALNVMPGTGVELRGKVNDGAWQVVARSTVGTDLTYSFAVTPAQAGSHRYQVSLVGANGQPDAQSPIAAVAVRWRPDVTLTVAARQLDGGQVLDLAGLSGVPESPVLIQRLRGEIWETVAEAQPTGGDSQYAATLGNAPRGTQFRAVVEGDGNYRLDGHSTIAASGLTPYELALDEGSTRIEDATDGVGALAHLEVPEAEEVTLALTDDNFQMVRPRVIGPDGQVVDGYRNPGGSIFRFMPAEIGRYTVEFVGPEWSAEGLAFNVWPTTSKDIQTPADAHDIDLSGGAPGQVIALIFDASAEDVITRSATSCSWHCPAVALADEFGIRVEELTFDTWRLPGSGRYALRYSPSDNSPLSMIESINLADTAAIEMDGDPVDIVLDEPNEAVRIAVQVEQGERVSLLREYNYEGVHSVLVDPLGHLVEGTGNLSGGVRFKAAMSGEYELAIRLNQTPSLTLTYWASTPMTFEVAVNGDDVEFDTGGAYGREVELIFDAAADTYLSLYYKPADDDPSYPAFGQLSGVPGYGAGGANVWLVNGAGRGRILFEPYDAVGVAGVTGKSVAEIVDLPSDGSSKTVAIDRPSGIALARFQVPPRGTWDRWSFTMQNVTLPPGSRFGGTVESVVGTLRFGFNQYSGDPVTYRYHKQDSGAVSGEYMVVIKAELDSTGTFDLSFLSELLPE